MTKSELTLFQERMDHRFVQAQQHLDAQLKDVRAEIKDTHNQIKESEFRLLTRLGFLTVSVASVAVATLTWLIKV